MHKVFFNKNIIFYISMDCKHVHYCCCKICVVSAQKVLSRPRRCADFADSRRCGMNKNPQSITSKERSRRLLAQRHKTQGAHVLRIPQALCARKRVEAQHISGAHLSLPRAANGVGHTTSSARSTKTACFTIFYWNPVSESGMERREKKGRNFVHTQSAIVKRSRASANILLGRIHCWRVH